MHEESRSICVLHNPPIHFSEGEDWVLALVVRREDHAHAEVHTPFKSRCSITKESWQEVWSGRVEKVDAPEWVKDTVFSAYPDTLQVQEALGKAHPRYWNSHQSKPAA